MQSRLQFATAALLAALAFGGVSTTKAADPDVRAAIMGRQKMRAELAAALSEGNLTPSEQYRLLLKAKQVLSPADFEGFQRTLDRMASSSIGIAPARERPAAKVRGSLRSLLTKEEDDETKGVSFESEEEIIPAPKPAPAAPGTPFLEEEGGEVARAGVVGDPCCGPADAACSDGSLFDEIGRMGRGGRLDISIFTAMDAFKGPLDLADLNGNFGIRFGINGAMPLSRRGGLGIQGGTSATIADFHGTPYLNTPAENGPRTQQFVTVGLFQRVQTRVGGLGWGFAYDWLFDDYIANSTMQFGQWRVKLAYELSPWNEIGIWSAIHDRGVNAIIGPPESFLEAQFRPLTQGNLYWRHTWMNEASVTGRFGIAEEPGEFVFGADSRLPISQRLALIGGFNYVLPSARGGQNGREEEMWNVSVGIEFVPGGAHRCASHRFAPFLPLADNGSFGIHRLP